MSENDRGITSFRCCLVKYLKMPGYDCYQNRVGWHYTLEAAAEPTIHSIG